MDISAGIVLFNPDIKRLKENIDAVIIQCTHLYLVDNGSGNVDEVKGLLNQYNQSKISILWNRENQGIAKALNQLTSAAQKEGFDWILTLDQDSVVPSNIVGEFEKYINNSSVGILCPIICDRNKDEEIKINEDCTEIDECITSGSLLNIKAWSEIGGFDERMFIDGVDFDICYRLRQRGYKIYCIHSVVLLHELGHIEYHRFLFWKVLVKNHSVFRKYYIARNIIYVAKKRKSVLLAIKGILQEVKLLGIVLLYETDKKSKSISIIKGIRDGAMLNTKRKEL
ncbi:glycosyltransferase family 2 protein [Streptococcus alactolyticus]